MRSVRLLQTASYVCANAFRSYRTEPNATVLTSSPMQVSQSVQFAPFTHDYDYNTDTTDEFEIFNSDVTQPNGYKGSAVQQAISGLTDLPSDIFNGTGGNFYTFGFEYWTDPSTPEDGYIIWETNGVETLKVGADAVGPDPLPDGTGVGQRLITEEPMVSCRYLTLHPMTECDVFRRLS